MVDVTRDKPVKLTVRVAVPVREHPKFNFVGKLLGPKGNSLKRLQEDTMTKMAILGRGSMKDRHKEEELRKTGDPKFSHLHDDLHVEITAFAPPAEAHARIAYALADVRRFLVPDYNDDIRQEQMWEMQVLKEQPEDLAEANDGSVSQLSGTAETPSSSNSMKSQSPPASILSVVGVPATLPLRHPALRGVSVPPALSAVCPVIGVASGKKRSLRSSSSNHLFSPSKRTLLSILTRARTIQAKQIPEYHITD